MTLEESKVFYLFIKSMPAKVPLVSIIVPIYNVESYLKKCLDSIVRQTYKNLEIILIDDGSTDNSGVIADKYAKKCKRIRILHKKNSGLSSARNAGLRIARGQWIAFVDSDDYVNNNYISKLVQLAIKRNADIATCNYNMVDLSGKIKKPSLHWTSKVLTGQEAVNDVFENKRQASIWLSLFKANIFKEHTITFPEGREYEDIPTRIKTLSFASKVAYTNERLYYYVIRKNSITHKDFTKNVYRDKIAAIRDMDKFLKINETKSNNLFYTYYKYRVIESILNDMANRNALRLNTKRIWHDTRKQLTSLYPNVEFPNVKTKIARKIRLILSFSQPLYCTILNKQTLSKIITR